MANEFKKALKKEQDVTARLHLDALYWHLIKLGKAKKVIRVDWSNECEYSQILQFVGADVILQKPNNVLSFMDEKICSYREQLYFEMDMAGVTDAGWAVSEAKKTDNIVYYIKGYGVFILPAKELRTWLLENGSKFPIHLSKEGSGRKSNRNVVVAAETVKQLFPNSFMDITELEIITNRYKEKMA